ncbi:hypothetical protein B0H10DRAFT_1939591 [Mycena sp. CBHHK59/15]|nr:hypothetical protein B0H10DRAFT_1939591 [Mycena sp. CBHHK59/15]
MTQNELSDGTRSGKIQTEKCPDMEGGSKARAVDSGKIAHKRVPVGEVGRCFWPVTGSWDPMLSCPVSTARVAPSLFSSSLGTEILVAKVSRLPAGMVTSQRHISARFGCESPFSGGGVSWRPLAYTLLVLHTGCRVRLQSRARLGAGVLLASFCTQEALLNVLIFCGWYRLKLSTYGAGLGKAQL